MAYQNSLLIDADKFQKMPPVYQSFITFYQQWVTAGCQPNWQGCPPTGATHRFMVDALTTGRPVVYFQPREYRAYNQETTWGPKRPFGGKGRHPTEALVDLLNMWRVSGV